MLRRSGPFVIEFAYITAMTNRDSMKSVLALALLLFFSSTASAETLFQCRMNATASRDFRFIGEPGWCGPTFNCGTDSSYGIKLFTKPSFDELSYREFLISLDEKSKTVSVKSFWSKDEDGKQFSEQFDAHIVSRDRNVVFFFFVNPYGNKVHSYALDLERRKLVAASVVNGATGIGH
jgi:hypothetical protein